MPAIIAAFCMSAAGLALLVIGLWAAKNDITQAHGLIGS